MQRLRPVFWVLSAAMPPGRSSSLGVFSPRHADDLLDTRFSADGTRVMTASRDRTISIWDVHLEGRKPDAIRKILSALDPWTLSNGMPVTVAAEPLRGNR